MCDAAACRLMLLLLRPMTMRILSWVVLASLTLPRSRPANMALVSQQHVVCQSMVLDTMRRCVGVNTMGGRDACGVECALAEELRCAPATASALLAASMPESILCVCSTDTPVGTPVAAAWPRPLPAECSVAGDAGLLSDSWLLAGLAPLGMAENAKPSGCATHNET